MVKDRQPFDEKMLASSIANGEFEHSVRNMTMLAAAMELNIKKLSPDDLERERAIYQQLLRDAPHAAASPQSTGAAPPPAISTSGQRDAESS
jgi:hypothetical protein